MYLPNYKDGSIVNLMSSIELALGGKPKYKSLKILPPSELSKSKNIVLLVIDGLGYEYLVKNKKDTVFNKYKINKITSVFPATTVAAITTFFTGDAPQQHAITGWFMYLKEIEAISRTLSFTHKDSYAPLRQLIKPKKIFAQKGFSKKIKTSSYIVALRRIVNSDFSLSYNKKAKKVPHENSLRDFFEQIEKTIKSNNRKKYIYAYWDEFDRLCHNFGAKSNQASKHFEKISAKLAHFLESIEDTTVIIVADHGFVDTPRSKVINLADHPKLKQTLTLPLCGEGRFAYCYVHPSKTEDFEKYVKTHLKNYCNLYKSDELIKKNYFGLFEPNKKLLDRIGDYVLLMKDNYIIKDPLAGEKMRFEIGNHGGTSKDEMFVPLVVIDRQGET